MILSNFSLDEQKRIRFVHVVDVYNDEKWVKQVKSLVNGVIEPNSKVGLIGTISRMSHLIIYDYFQNG